MIKKKSSLTYPIGSNHKNTSCDVFAKKNTSCDWYNITFK